MRGTIFSSIRIALAIVLGVGPVLQSVGSVSALAAPPSSLAAVAIEAGAPVVVGEVVENRTEFTREFELSDGSVRVQYFSAPVHYEDPESGEMLPVDVSLEDTVSAGRSVKSNKANSFRLEIPRDLDDDWVSLETSRATFAMRPVWENRRGQAKVPPGIAVARSRAATEVVYPDAFDEASLEYESLPDGLKETIVLDRLSDKHIFSFRLALDGLAPLIEPDGSIALRSTDSTEVVMSIPAPFMEDSSDPADGTSFSTAVHYEIKGQGANYILDVVADPDWLSDPERIYPVRIDPTVTTTSEIQSGGNDTYISSRSGYQSTSHISSTYVWVNTNNPSANWTEYGYMQPHGDLITDMATKKAQGMTVVASRLKLYAYSIAAAGTVYGRMCATSGSVYLPSLTWLTRANAVAVSTYPAPNLSVTSTGWKTLDVTSMVANWQTLGLSQSYCTLRLNISTGDHVGFYSANASSSSVRPKWEIDYAKKPTVALSAPTSGLLQAPPMAAWGFDGYGNTQAEWKVELAEGTTANVVASNGGESTVQVGGLPVPPGGFQPDTTYHVRVQAAIAPTTLDSRMWSEWSSWGSFTLSKPTVDLTAPTSGEVTSAPQAQWVFADQSGNDQAEWAVEVATAPGGAPVASTGESTADGYAQLPVPPGGLQGNTTYYVRARAASAPSAQQLPRMWSDWSEWGSFTTVVPSNLATLSAEPTASAGWFNRSFQNGQFTLNDWNDGGRGSVTLDWAPSSTADGYHVYLFDGLAYQRVGATLGRDATTWSTSGAQLFPRDSAIDALTEPYASNPFAGAASPAAESRTGSIPTSQAVDARVVLTDNTSLYTRINRDDAWYWAQADMDGDILGVYSQGEDMSGRLTQSAFLANGVLYNGYADTASRVVGTREIEMSVAQATIAGGNPIHYTPPLERSATTATLEFARPLLDSTSGAELGGPSSNVILAAKPQDGDEGTAVYSVASGVEGRPGAGFTIREYLLPYDAWTSGAAAFVSDHVITAESFDLGGAIVTPEALVLVEANTAHSQRRILKLDRTNGMSVINEWIGDAEHVRSTNGCLVTDGDMGGSHYVMGSPKTATEQATLHTYVGPGLELRDNPNLLYRKTAPTSSEWCDRNDYQFKVIPFDADFGEPAFSGEASVTVALDNRTVDVDADARHTTFDLNDMANHDAEVQLDTASLRFEISDLDIASYGPDASLSRTYSSGDVSASAFAPGWRFDFERHLEISPGADRIEYVDEDGDRHPFREEGGLYHAPVGYYATLKYDSNGLLADEYTLSFKDRSHLRFRVEGNEAFLVEEVDRNGQATEYRRNGGFLWYPETLDIVAANGRKITVTFGDDDRVEGATYETPAGRREIGYSFEASGTTGGTAMVTYLESFEGQPDAYSVAYAYENDRIVSMWVPEKIFAGREARWDFDYEQSRVSTLTAPASAGGNRASIGLVFRMAQESEVSSATVTRSAEVSGTVQTVFQDYGWNPTGTLAYRGNERLASDSHSRWIYEYSSTNEAIRETSPTGKLQQRDLDVRGNVRAEHDEDHHVVSYTYEIVTDEFGTYDQMRTKMDPRGNITRFAYDSRGNIASLRRRLTLVEESDNRYEYDPQGRKVAERTLLWNHGGEKQWLVEEREYDSALGLDDPSTVTQRAEIESPLGEVALVDIDLGLGVTTPSVVVATEHDAFGSVLRQIDAAGVVTMSGATYSAFGKLMASVDVDGVTTRNRYDSLGRLVETSSTVAFNPYGSTVSNWNVTEIDAEGRTVREESRAANGSVNTWTTYGFDDAGRGVITTDSVAGVSATWFDARGNAVATWEPGAYNAGDPDLVKATRARYQLDGTSTWACDAGKPDSAAVTKEFRPDGLLLKMNEADGSWMRYVYDPADNLIAEIAPTEQGGLAIAENSYDEGGRLYQTRSAEGMVGRTYYDLADRPVLSVTVEGEGEQETETTATVSVFNELGLEVSSTDSDGVTKSTGYDVLGNVVSERTVDASGTVISTVAYQYDSKKRLASRIVTENGVSNKSGYRYDAFGRSIEESHTKAGAVTKHENTWYDEYDRPTRIVDSKRDIVREYTYSGGGKKKSTERLGYGSVTTTVTVNEHERETTNTAHFSLGARSLDVTREVGWDAVRSLAMTSTLKIGSGSWSTAYAYDYGDKLAGISGGMWGTGGVTASYNTTGTATKVGDVVTLPWGGQTSRTFGYTLAGRLSTATVTPPGGPARQLTYSWDPDGTGDLLGFTDGAESAVMTYEGGHVQSLSANGRMTVYGFDTAGRRVLASTAGQGSVETSWTGDDRLSTWVEKSSASAVEASATYAYDGDGQRVSATVVAPNPWSQSATQTVYTYGWDGLELRWMQAASDSSAARLTYLYDEADRPYAASIEATVSGEATSAVFALMTTDHGDVVGLADESGVQFARYSYGPFGEVEGVESRGTTELSAVLAAQIAELQPLRYACYNYDAWSGTYYLQARHYDPITKQFLSKDPAEADGEESAYQYCAGDPVNQDDPDGEFAQVLWGAVGGAAWYAGEQAIKGAWKARSVFKKQGFKAGMRATWRNVKKSWSWKQFGKEVAIGAATGGLGKLAKAGRFAKAGAAARGARCRVLSRGSRFANKASRGRIPAKTFCFVAGTLVLTASGTMPIEAVAVGDSVLSRDAATGEQVYRQVTETFVNTTDELIHVRTAEDTVTATPAHPFWVEGTGWVDAGELEAGMALSRADGERATILSVTREKLSSPRDVYNFEVEGFHTYFVASTGVWVHNACAGFRDVAKKADHFARHGAALFRNADDYERAGRRLASRRFGVQRYLRADGDVVVHNVRSNRMAVRSSDGYLRTYMPVSKRYFGNQLKKYGGKRMRWWQR